MESGKQQNYEPPNRSAYSRNYDNGMNHGFNSYGPGNNQGQFMGSTRRVIGKANSSIMESDEGEEEEGEPLERAEL